MSDDEDLLLTKKLESLESTINIASANEGTREEQERARLAALASALMRDTGDGSSNKELGQIHISNEYMELEDEMSKDKQALLEEFERRRKARQINVSTDDSEVRRSLRQLGEPVCLFGEGPAERRARLRDLLSFLGEDAIHKRMEEEEARLQQERGQEGTWYHEGSMELRNARIWIAQYSLPNAKERLKRAHEEETSVKATARAAVRQELQRRLGSTAVVASQVGGARPLTYCSFSSDSQMLATASWSGLCNIWSAPSCEAFHSLRGHTCQVGSIVFRPQAKLPPHFKNRNAPIEEEAKICSLASCGYDGSVLLWNLASEEPIGELPGHAPSRVSRVAFHPSGRYLGSCVRDGSWRLWDLEVKREVLHQEGHAKSPHCIAFQSDGSVAATGGLDTFGRVWDLRTGRCIMLMEGHQNSIYDVAWSPSGYQLATASGDNSARIWDLRRRSCLYTIPAHTSLLSGIRYQQTSGHYLVTTSYDNTVKLWGNITWQPLRTLEGHDSKVMGLDISPDDKYIATCSYDRTFKLWAAEG